MPTSKKVFTVANLEEKLKQAKGLILADYTGLNVSQMSGLRREVKKAGGELEVVKNTLLRLAAKNFQLPIANFQLKEPTAALWIYQEETAPLKALYQFIRQTDLPKIKFGFWNQEPISEEKIKELAFLPGLAELRIKLVSSLQSPIYGLANSLKWNIGKLVLILKSKAQNEKN